MAIRLWVPLSRMGLFLTQGEGYFSQEDAVIKQGHPTGFNLSQRGHSSLSFSAVL